MKSWRSMSMEIAASREPSLIELVDIRASQINGANCINMHRRGAGQRRDGTAHLPVVGPARGSVLVASARLWVD
jgi:AhpD family alkylhydroperoxidase